MYKFFLIFFLMFFNACTKPQVILICGDHECINKKEANQFFEENLSIEVKIINLNKDSNEDLVELNLKNNEKEKEINFIRKKETKNKVKTLTDSEIIKIKEKIKKKEVAKRNNNKNKLLKENDVRSKRNMNEKQGINKKMDKKIVKKKNDTLDICTILEKCSIEEISNYLIKEGKKKKFPDITLKE